tara:strand:- start:411 stop:539 length:129 start_codon:yes stop_codon:yes gene_type:complete
MKTIEFTIEELELVRNYLKWIPRVSRKVTDVDNINTLLKKLR